MAMSLFLILITKKYLAVRTQNYTEQRGQSPQDPIVEVVTPEVYNADGSRDPFSQIWSRTLRIKIIGRDGFEKLDVRIPVSHISSLDTLYYCVSNII